MRGFILTNRSVITCPHSGIVNSYPSLWVTRQVAGGIPILFNDSFYVDGCQECYTVNWTSPSATFLIDGIPALVHTSVGLCRGYRGETTGMANILSFQTTEREPSNPTNHSPYAGE